MKTLTLLRQRGRVLALAGLLLCAGILTGSSGYVGALKPVGMIDWVDLCGEATTSAMSLIWFVLLLSCRVKGRVTSLLLLGAGCYWLTTWLDLLDEFIHYPPSQKAFTWLESLPAPISMLLMTWGVWRWYEEQQVINRQLQQREHFHREHGLIDPATQLYSLRYFLIQLRREAQLQDHNAVPVAVIAVNIDAFSSFNRRHGSARGDKALLQLAQAIEVPLRSTDLACRHASDQFILLLPNTSSAQVSVLAQQVRQCCADTFNGELTVTTAYVVRKTQEREASLLKRLQLSIQATKRAQQQALRRTA